MSRAVQTGAHGSARPHPNRQGQRAVSSRIGGGRGSWRKPRVTTTALNGRFWPTPADGRRRSGTAPGAAWRPPSDVSLHNPFCHSRRVARGLNTEGDALHAPNKGTRFVGRPTEYNTLVRVMGRSRRLGIRGACFLVRACSTVPAPAGLNRDTRHGAETLHDEVCWPNQRDGREQADEGGLVDCGRSPQM